MKPVKHDTPNNEIVKEFATQCSANVKLFAIKNIRYGNAITETGVIGATVELIGCVARLKQLVLKDAEHGRLKKEDIRNVAKDAHNYANILLLMLNSDNWEGE